jgi:hypothetical protein
MFDVQPSFSHRSLQLSFDCVKSQFSSALRKVAHASQKPSSPQKNASIIWSSCLISAHWSLLSQRSANTEPQTPSAKDQPAR